MAPLVMRSRLVLDELLLELYKEGVRLLDVPHETEYDENDKWPTLLTLTLVDLVDGRVENLVEGDGTEDMNTVCYGFTPEDS